MIKKELLIKEVQIVCQNTNRNERCFEVYLVHLTMKRGEVAFRLRYVKPINILFLCIILQKRQVSYGTTTFY